MPDQTQPPMPDRVLLVAGALKQIQARWFLSWCIEPWAHLLRMQHLQSDHEQSVMRAVDHREQCCLIQSNCIDCWAAAEYAAVHRHEEMAQALQTTSHLTGLNAVSVTLLGCRKDTKLPSAITSCIR